VAADKALELALAEIAAEPGVLGVVAVGSWVAGDMVEGSDLDLVVLHDGSRGRQRGLRVRRHGLLLDLKYWTPEVAAANLAGPEAAAIIAATGGVRVLLDRDGSAASLADAILRAASAPVAPLHPWERVHLDQARVTLEGPARRAIEAGDLPQARALMHHALTLTIEAAFRLRGVPYRDFGKGLRDLRRHFPEIGRRADAALSLADAEECRRALLAMARDVLGGLAFEGDEFDTGWLD
jgi:hypothetical protein